MSDGYYGIPVPSMHEKVSARLLHHSSRPLQKRVGQTPEQQQKTKAGGALQGPSSAEAGAAR